ncbi:LysE family transporter [Thermodesulfovibrio sp. 3907-1M]|uniref:LysE family transporter n=1 Tax=Thermodesulfovibrio autotrophicus TaxID=3118333 RepID=A0AAU8GUP8_9BACT
MFKILFIGLSSFLIALSGAMMPGPLFAITVSETPRRGWLTGPILVAGHGVLELSLLLLIVSGLGSFLQMNETFIVVALVGGLFLFIMGLSMFRSLPELSLQNEFNRQAKGSLFLSGILLSLANPYWSFWWATIGLGYLVQAMEIGVIGIVAFFTGHILGDLAWYSGVSVGVYKGKKVLNDSLYRKIVFLCALILMGFSFYFIWTGIKRAKYFF